MDPAELWGCARPHEVERQRQWRSLRLPPICGVQLCWHGTLDLDIAELTRQLPS